MPPRTDLGFRLVIYCGTRASGRRLRSCTVAGSGGASHPAVMRLVRGSSQQVVHSLWLMKKMRPEAGATLCSHPGGSGAVDSSLNSRPASLTMWLMKKMGAVDGSLIKGSTSSQPAR